MITRYNHGDLTWVDLESPTQEEVLSLMDEFALDPLSGEELFLPSLKPKVDAREHYIYLILHFPAAKHTHTSASQEVDFIVGRKFIITARYDTIDPLHKFSKVFEANSILDKSDIGERAGFILYYMLRKLYRSVDHELEYISDALSDIEMKMFAGKEREMVFEISTLSKELLGFKRTLHPHREVLESLETPARNLFGTSFGYYIRGLSGECYRVYESIGTQLDAVNELRETNNSLLSTKQNEITKTLTIMAFVVFPLTLFASLFGMNTTTLPLTGFENDFWWIILIMLAAAGAIFSFFKGKGWL